MSNLIVVALPSADDYINKISSEQVAHMTLLFLGEDASKVKNLDRIMSFVEHATNEMLTRFNLYVDRRGVLGPDSSDVIFFRQSGCCFEDVSNFRSSLLQDNDIRTANESTVQYDEWVPHLTLGYPATPANPDDRDYPGIYSVNFDRIAVWDQDYAGTEFLLEQDDDYMMMSVGENAVGEILEHHGVPGMRWGHRTGHFTSATSSSSRSEKRSAKKLAKKDAKFEKRTTNTNQNFKLKIQLHNATTDHMNKFIPEYNKKWSKEIDSGKLLNTEGSAYKKYTKGYMAEYEKRLNIEAEKLGTNASGTRKYHVVQTNDLLGFTVHTMDVKHAASDGPAEFEVRFIRDKTGAIVNLEFVNDNLAQSAIEHILTLHGADKV